MRILPLLLLLTHFSLLSQSRLDSPLKISGIHSVSHSNGQHDCGDEISRTMIMGRYPNLSEKESEMNQAIRNARMLRSDNREEDRYVSVVVHVLYLDENGPENISDEQIQQAISDLNNAFSNTGDYQSPDGVDTHIRFCLAQQDPDGFPTTGITRHQSSLTNMTMETEDLMVKSAQTWDQTRYLNIWIVASINSISMGSGVAGYAYLPYSHGLPEDGIVNEAEWFGSSTHHSKIHIHEVGHYLGLYHTFQNGCLNNDCSLDGDQVCDTPPDMSTAPNNCSTPQNTCFSDEDDTSAQNPFRPIALGGLGDQNDLTENYMDYSNQICQTLFTTGQSERMNLALDVERSSLLESDGCVSSCGIGAISFNPLPEEFLAGTPYFISQTTMTIVNVTYQWTFQGEVISTQPNMTHTFSNEDIGENYLVLTITNAQDNCYRADSIAIVVKCNPPAAISMSPQYLELNDQVTFNGLHPQATTYQWYLDGALISTDAIFNTTFETPESHLIYLITGNGICQDTSEIKYFAVGQCVGGQNNHWILGSGAGVQIDFTTGQPVATSVPLVNENTLSTIEGISTISDQNGELLFYTDGNRFFNRNYELFYEIAAAGPSSAQGALIVPSPGNNSIYYAFLLENFGGMLTIPGYATDWGYRYVTIDMSLNSGLGGFSAISPTLIENPYEAQCALKHCNGRDIWVVARSYSGNSYYSFLIDENGVHPPVISEVGYNVNDETGYLGLGCMKASPQGDKLAITHTYGGVQVFHFDSNTGVITDDYAQLNSSLTYFSYGVAFSPDGTKLYFSSDYYPQIYQCDLSSGNPEIMSNSIMVVANASMLYYKGAMELGPDGKIYSIAGIGENRIDIISNPNAAGLACNYIAGGLEVPEALLYGLQNTYSNTYRDSGPQITGPTQVCANAGNITYSVSCGENEWTYHGNNTYSEVSSESIDINFTTPGVDTLICREIHPCFGTLSDTIFIQVGMPEIFLGNDTSICSTGNITLEATGQFISYLWSNWVSTATNTVSEPGEYWVEVTSLGGCMARDTISITTYSSPFDLPNDTLQICSNMNNWYYLDAHEGEYTHHWWSLNGPSTPTLAINIDANYPPSQIPIFYINPFGCISEEQVIIVSRPEPEEIFIPENLTLCQDEIAVIEIDESNCPQCSYTWQDGTHANPYTIYSNNQDWTTTYWVNRYDSLCNVYTINYIDVSAPSAEDFQLPDSVLLCDNTPYTLISYGSFDNYEWQDGSSAHYYETNGEGTYWVKSITPCGIFSDTTVINVYDDTQFALNLNDTLQICEASLPYIFNLSNPNIYGYGINNGNSGVITAEGMIVVTGYHICGSSVDSMYVEVSPSPANPLMSSMHLCDSVGVWLSLPEDQFNVWENEIISDSIFANVEGIYHFSTSIGNQCTIHDSVSIHFHEISMLINDTTICTNDTIIITPITNATSWFWSYQNQIFLNEITVSDTGTYQVYYSDSYCSDFTTFHVNEQDGSQYSLILPDSIFVCSHELPITIAAEGDLANNYQWSTGSTTASAITSNSGWHILNTTYNCGQKIDSTYLMVFESPIMTLPNDSVLCENQIIQLNASSTYSNYWSNGSTENEINVTQGGTYILISTTEQGCELQDTIQIIPSDLFLELDSLVYNCSNDTMILTPITNGESYYWSNGTTSLNTNVIGGGSLSFTTIKDNCEQTSFIDVIPLFIENFNLGNDTLVNGSSYIIQAPDSYDSYTWNVPNENTHSLEIYNSGTYELSVTDENGCEASDQITVLFNNTSSDSFIEVPEVFYYESGGLIARYQNVQVYDIKIFDDIGRLVQYGNTFPMVWDGATTSHNPASSAMYFYIINYTDSSGEQKTKKGNVLLVK